MRFVPRCTEVLYDVLLLLTFVGLVVPQISVCVPDDPMNSTCSLAVMPPSILRPRLIPPRAPHVPTKARFASLVSSKRATYGGAEFFGGASEVHGLRVCAWLERGGIFDSALLPGPRPRAFVVSRLVCTRAPPPRGPAADACGATWADFDDPRAVTFKWIGTDDMRLYEFQLHMCSDLPSRPLCRNQGDLDGEVEEEAFELQQRGTWLYLHEFRCRCRVPAEIHEITYARPVPPATRFIDPRFISMKCWSPPVCGTLSTPCYYEVPNADGLLTSGIYACQCPRRYFCDVYHIRQPRASFTTNTSHLVFLTFCRLSFF